MPNPNAPSPTTGEWSFACHLSEGDTGSLVVGFLLGFLAVLLTQGEGKTVSPLLPVLVKQQR